MDFEEEVSVHTKKGLNRGFTVKNSLLFAGKLRGFKVIVRHIHNLALLQMHSEWVQLPENNRAPIKIEINKLINIE